MELCLKLLYRELSEHTPLIPSQEGKLGILVEVYNVKHTNKLFLIN